MHTGLGPYHSLLFLKFKAVGYDYVKDELKSQKLLARMQGLIGDDMINASTFDHHACLRPVSGDDVPIIGQTLVYG